MTYFSNWVELKDDPGVNAKDAFLWNFGERYGPYKLGAWAKGKGLAIEYVDPCWLRVEVGGKELWEFLNELGKQRTPHVANSLPKIDESSRYIIVAEEF